MKKNPKEILNSYRCKATPARISILGAFSIDCNPINADQIYHKIKKSGIDLVTVYRTLTSFEEVGLIRRVNGKKDSTYYELNADHHHHVICTDCERVSEFTDDKDASIIDMALKKVKDFKSITYHSFDLFGLCNSCAKK